MDPAITIPVESGSRYKGDYCHNGHPWLVNHGNGCEASGGGRGGRLYPTYQPGPSIDPTKIVLAPKPTPFPSYYYYLPPMLQA